MRTRKLRVPDARGGEAPPADACEHSASAPPTNMKKAGPAPCGAGPPLPGYADPWRGRRGFVDPCGEAKVAGPLWPAMTTTRGFAARVVKRPARLCRCPLSFGFGRVSRLVFVCTHSAVWLSVRKYYHPLPGDGTFAYLHTAWEPPIPVPESSPTQNNGLHQRERTGGPRLQGTEKRVSKANSFLSRQACPGGSGVLPPRRPRPLRSLRERR